jgi:probable HAF family extracellular repeat protein
MLRPLNRSLPIGLGLLAFGLLPWVAFAQNYTLTDLGPGVPKGLNATGDVLGDSFVYDGQRHDLPSPANGYVSVSNINAVGQIAFTTSSTDNSGNTLSQACLYSRGNITSFGTLGGNNSSAYWVDDSGRVVGVSDTANGTSHGFLYVNGTMTDLGTLGGNNSIPEAFNAAGVIIGQADTAEGFHHAFAWFNGTMTDLGTLGGGNSSAYLINASGQIAGTSETAAGSTDAFLYFNGTMTDLGTLRGVESSPYAMNDAGMIVGESDGSAFIYTNGTMTALPGGEDATHIDAAGDALGDAQPGMLMYWPASGGNGVALTLPGNPYSLNGAMNASGQVVGFSTPEQGGGPAGIPHPGHPFLYAHGNITDLNKLNITGNQGWMLTFFTLLPSLFINDSGQIVVTAYLNSPSISPHAVLLTPGITKLPNICLQPLSASVTLGTKYTLSVAVTGATPFKYQWQFNGANITGATKSTYAIAKVSLATVGNYTVIVTNAYGNVTSIPASLTLNGPPVFNEDPTDVQVVAGQAANFTSYAYGVPAATYQWQFSRNDGTTWANFTNGGNISGATGQSLTISPATPVQSGLQIRVAASNIGGTTFSAIANLTVLSGPILSFATFPDIAKGETTFPHGADGANIVGSFVDGNQTLHGFLLSGNTYTILDGPLAGQNLNNWANAISGKNIVGRYYDAQGAFHGYLYNGNTYTTLDDPLANVTADSGTSAIGVSGGNVVGYYLDADGLEHGFLYNGTAFTTIDDPLGDQGTIIYDISGGNLVGSYVDAYGDTHGFLYDGANFTTLDAPLGAFGTSPSGIFNGNVVGYYNDQNDNYHGFLYDGTHFLTVDFPGSTDSNLNHLTTGYAVGGYADAKGNEHGFIVQLMYLGLSAQSGNQTAVVGSRLTLSVNATGAAPLSYQWLLNGANIKGATKSTYTISKLSLASAGNYTVVLTNIQGQFTSGPIVVAIPPTITTQPKALVLRYLAGGNLTVAATGSPTLNFLWHQNQAVITASNVAGINGPILMFTAATPTNAGNYTVTVSNNSGSVTSIIAPVTVNVPKP